ncbi:MAG: alanine racemase [Clostridia bacterium]|nr:alanine racemase [Clostridia bacterium]
MNSIHPTARAWAQIDLAAMTHNFNIAKSTGKKVMCVIKANAYGHGAVPCGLHLQQLGADFFAVACLAEAIELRRGGISKPILILGYTPAEYAAELAQHDITQTVYDMESAKALSTEAAKAGVTIDAHVKVDTGMSRIGIYAQNKEAASAAAEEIEGIYSLPNLVVKGVYTHFSVADDMDQTRYTNWQLSNYKAVLDALSAKGIHPELRHAGNTAAIMNHPDSHFDMIRAGIMLYGMYPDGVHRNGPLRPVMTLKSRVAQIRELPAGASVSYGRTYETKKPTRMAVITAGYADGHPRRISDDSYDIISGRSFPQIGRICMDMHMLDITGDDTVKVGDEVSLWGGEGMTAEQVAERVGTLNYELTCLITPRIARVYIDGTEIE